MIELKSKKTGRVTVISNEEYAKVKDHPGMVKFIVTPITTRPLIPSLQTKTKNK